MLPEMLEATARTYPGVASLAERMLPTYPRHAGRRATEMSELESTAAAAGLEPVMIAAVRQAHEALAGVWPAGADNAGPAASEIEPLLRLLAGRLNESTKVV